jgi:hypothetical protein
MHHNCKINALPKEFGSWFQFYLYAAEIGAINNMNVVYYGNDGVNYIMTANALKARCFEELFELKTLCN